MIRHLTTTARDVFGAAVLSVSLCLVLGLHLVILKLRLYEEERKK